MNQASARLCSVISAESLIVTGEEGGQVKNKWLRIKYKSNTFMLPTQQGHSFVFYKNHSVLIINTAALIIQTTRKRQAIKAERMWTKLLKMVEDRKQLSLPSFWGHNLVTHHHIWVGHGAQLWYYLCAYYPGSKFRFCPAAMSDGVCSIWTRWGQVCFL